MTKTLVIAFLYKFKVALVRNKASPIRGIQVEEDPLMCHTGPCSGSQRPCSVSELHRSAAGWTVKVHKRGQLSGFVRGRLQVVSAPVYTDPGASVGM